MSFRNARRLDARGAALRELNPRFLSDSEQERISVLTRRGLASRRFSRADFLLESDPWYQSAHKRYFLLECRGQYFCYAVVLPVPSRNSWHIAQLLRDPAAPPGSTELLVLSLLERLRSQGEREATLGISFDPAFSKKFRPTSWEPRFVATNSPRWGWRSWLQLNRALFPKGLAFSLVASVVRAARRLQPARWIESRLIPGVAPRPLPTLSELVTRLDGTLLVAQILCVVGFFSSASHTEPGIRFGYYLPVALHEPWRVLGSTLFHWSPSHLAFSLLLLAGAGGLIEVLSGTRVFLICFLAGAIAANPIVSLMAWALNVPDSLLSIDLGALCGTFACVGALCQYLRSGHLALVLLLTGSIAFALGCRDFQALNLSVALLLGRSALRATVRRSR